MAGELQYTQSAGSSIAYRVLGEGSITIVIAHPNMSTMRLFRRGMSEVLPRLAAFAKVVLFDRRGWGQSDPIPLDAWPTVEEWSEDILAVMDATETVRAALVGFLGGGWFASCCAARHPDRVTHLVLMHMLAKQAISDDYPWGVPPERRLAEWNAAASGYRIIPEYLDVMGSGADPEAYRRYMQAVASPAMMAQNHTYSATVDLREHLSRLTVPTLVLHRRDNRFIPFGAAEDLAARIPGAKLIALPGDNQNVITDQSGIAEEIQEFLTGSRPTVEPERFLAAVMFTDIVASTDSKAKTGDKKWRDLLAEHNRICRKQIADHGGREMNTTGDGFLATFDVPARAVACAHSIMRALASTDIHIRAGIHAGEVERIDEDITGLTVDIGARVAALAGPDEVLVSSTVRDMAIGSSLLFDERGTHELKGVPGEWRLYAASTMPATI